MFQASEVRRRPLISLTPLIDVVFILLVFFMLASSFLNWRAIDLSSPPAAGSGVQTLKGAMLVEVRSDHLRLGTRTLDLESIVARVSAHLENKPDQRVLIRPAAGVPLQRAVHVLDRLAAAGARNLALVRSPR